MSTNNRSLLGAPQCLQATAETRGQRMGQKVRREEKVYCTVPARWTSRRGIQCGPSCNHSAPLLLRRKPAKATSRESATAHNWLCCSRGAFSHSRCRYESVLFRAAYILVMLDYPPAARETGATHQPHPSRSSKRQRSVASSSLCRAIALLSARKAPISLSDAKPQPSSG